MELIDKLVPTDEHLREAIALRCSRVFGALNIANALGGDQSVPWRLLRTFSLVDLVIEAQLTRKLDLSTLDCAVEGGKVCSTDIYKKAIDCATKKGQQ
jgi:hypothetical protein